MQEKTKKILLISLIILLSLTSCKKEKTPIENSPQVSTGDLITRDSISQVLYDYAIEIYNNKSYKDFEKNNGKYKITIDDLRDKFNYDVTMIRDTTDGYKLVLDKTYIEIDEDNLEKLNYKKYPILITTYYDE